MTRWAMAIDLDTCSACGACLVACAQENNVPPGDPAQAEDRLIRWMELLPIEEGEYPHTRAKVLPMPCQHCEHPPCTTVCPVYATYKTDDGLVAQVYPQCIGCRYCVNACPYTCKHYNWDEPWPPPLLSTLGRGLNPDVSLRTRGVTEKCNFCLHRLQHARDVASAEKRPLGPDDYRTACQEVCPTKAILFGDLDDPDSPVAQAAHGPRATRLLEELGTDPKVFFLKERG